MYLKSDKEGQFDLGLVDRLGKRVQAGVFASFKHVSLGGYQTGGTLGQAAFSRGLYVQVGQTRRLRHLCVHG